MYPSRVCRPELASAHDVSEKIIGRCCALVNPTPGGGFWPYYPWPWAWMVGLEPFPFCLCLPPLPASSPFRVPMAVHGGGRVDGAPPGLPRLPCLGVCLGGVDQHTAYGWDFAASVQASRPRHLRYQLRPRLHAGLVGRGAGQRKVLAPTVVPLPPENTPAVVGCPEVGGGPPLSPTVTWRWPSIRGEELTHAPATVVAPGPWTGIALRAGGSAGRDGFEAQ